MSATEFAAPAQAARLSATGITKRYPGVRALADVGLTLRAGEIHGLIGQNGAGKSTLVKILSGSEQPDSGTIEIDGRAVALHRPADAQRAGVQTIHQELSLVPRLSVAENVFLGDPPTRVASVVDRREMRRRARDTLREIGFELDVSRPADSYSIAEQQGIELAKALHREARIILLDEPTATLPAPDIDRLFAVLRKLARDGAALVYISHRLEEISELCDVVTVLRDGELVTTRRAAELSSSEMVNAMIGDKQVRLLAAGQIEGERAPALGSGTGGDTVLSVAGLADGTRFSEVSFDLHEGEVFGLVGLVGSGQSQIASCVAGMRPPTEGEVRVGGREVRLHSPREAVRRGIGLLPQDRKAHGFVPGMSVAGNMTLASLPQFSRFAVRNRHRETAVARQLASRLDMRIADVSQSMRTLSGGNQQKAIMARWIVRSVRVLVCDEPTRGVDVAAKEEMYELIREFARQPGHAVIIATSELSEALMCDRVLVMAGGRPAAELAHDDIDPHGDAILDHFV